KLIASRWCSNAGPCSRAGCGPPVSTGFAATRFALAAVIIMAAASSAASKGRNMGFACSEFQMSTYTTIKTPAIFVRDPMDILTPDAALALADRHWRIHGDICALPSYADQNFRIRTRHGEYVLKVAHPSWSRLDLDLENQAMMTL